MGIFQIENSNKYHTVSITIFMAYKSLSKEGLEEAPGVFIFYKLKKPVKTA